MSTPDHSEYARAAAISVNYALDSVEADIRRELEAGTGEASEVLGRLLAKLRKRRVDTNSLASHEQLH